MSPHPLTNFEVQKYHNYAHQSSKNETRFNGVYSRDNLPEIKDGAYVINPDEYSDIGTHCIALYVLNNDLLILIVLEQNIFHKKLKHLSVIKK